LTINIPYPPHGNYWLHGFQENQRIFSHQRIVKILGVQPLRRLPAQVCNWPNADVPRVACLPIWQGLVAAAADVMRRRSRIYTLIKLKGKENKGI
jgi:hypothetical protein